VKPGGGAAGRGRRTAISGGGSGVTDRAAATALNEAYIESAKTTVQELRGENIWAPIDLGYARAIALGHARDVLFLGASLQAAEEERDWLHGELDAAQANLAMWHECAEKVEARLQAAERNGYEAENDRISANEACVIAEAQLQVAEEALRRIANHPWRVSDTAENELQSVKEIAHAALEALEGERG